MIPYLWIKAVHVAAVLIFIAGLPSQCLGVAAARCGDCRTAALVSQWDRRVTVPAMFLAWLTGATIAADGGWFKSPWLWGKLALVLALTGLHAFQSGRLRRIRRGEQLRVRTQPEGIAASIVIAAAIIAFLVVVKPV